MTDDLLCPAWFARLDHRMKTYRDDHHPALVALSKFRVRIWSRLSGQRCFVDYGRCDCTLDCARHGRGAAV